MTESCAPAPAPACDENNMCDIVDIFAKLRENLDSLLDSFKSS